jgi:hypothetical protein
MRVRNYLLGGLSLVSLQFFAGLGYGNGGICPKDWTGINFDRSLVIHDPNSLKASFGFDRTIGAILTSLNLPNTSESQKNFVQTLISSFNATEQVNLASGLRMKVDPRPREAALKAEELLNQANANGLIPVGLFNRLDLVPKDWSNCGEHRIVYAIPASSTEARFFLIFEANLRNPHPEKGQEGCVPVAKFWLGLASLDEADVIPAAADFYYNGLDQEFGPVVTAKNFGMPFGQVRGNLFVGGPNESKWQLREWRVVPFGEAAGATFLPVTVKSNPLTELYGDDSNEALDPAKQEVERAAFQSEFLDKYVNQLIEPDLNETMNVDEHIEFVINTFGAKIDDRFNEFQSDSQGSDDDPQSTAAGIRPGITAKLDSANLKQDRKLGEKELLDRAGAITCGGCHEFSSNCLVGRVANKEIKWPESPSDITRHFVHITEGGVLSDALTGSFLPFRAKKLFRAACEPPEPPAAAIAAITGDGLAELDALVQQMTSREPNLLAVDQAQREARFTTLSTQLERQEVQKDGFFIENRRPH